MSQNIKQVYDSNPSVTLQENDLLYAGKSPYGVTNDTAIKYSDFVAQLATTDSSAVAACLVATTANLSADYNNGTAGVGAKLTNNGAQVALSIDGVSLSVNDRVLVSHQTSALENGIYTVTTVGSGATNWVLTRATDYNTTALISQGSYTNIIDGATYPGSFFMQTSSVPIIGTDPISFVGLPTTITGAVTIQDVNGANAGGMPGGNIQLHILGNYTSGSVTGAYGKISIGNDRNKEEAAFFGAYRVGAFTQAWGCFGVRTGGNDYITGINSSEGDTAITGVNYSTGFYLSTNPFDSLITNTTKLMGIQLANNMAQNTFINLYDPGVSVGVMPIFTVTTSGLMAQTAAGLGSIVNSAIWHTTVSSTGQNMTVGGSYSRTNSSLQIYNLPTSSAAGEIVRINDAGTGRLRIGQGANQFIQSGINVTSTGTGGYLQSTAKGDSITVETIVATNQWQVVSMIGNWTVV